MQGKKIPLECSFSGSLVFLHCFCTSGLVLELHPRFLSASTFAFRFVTLWEERPHPAHGSRVLSMALWGERWGLMELDARVRYLAERR